ncbi:MAG: hypothetical protein H3C38_18435 [Rhodospirillales bacterium]|nr:hypothetical protein [Rhodospirillales bacterium]
MCGEKDNPVAEWQAFERAVKKLVNTPPKHRTAKKPAPKDDEAKNDA